MGVQFDNSIVSNHAPAQTVEDAFRVYGSWANIHDYSFDELLTVADASITTVTVNDWSNKNILSTVMPNEILLSCEIPSSESISEGFAVIVGYDDNNNDGYAIGVDNTGKVFLASYDGTSMITLESRTPAIFPTYGDVKVAFRQQTFSHNESDNWYTYALWINDTLIDTFSIYAGVLLSSGRKCGFAYYGTNADFTIQNVQIPQLTQFVEWNSIDPGEPPIGGLSRTIEGRYLKHFVRFDGSLRAWRSHPISSSKSFTDANDLYLRSSVWDKRKLYSHVRLLGAWTEAEFISAPLVLKVGHRFTEINNPFLMSVDECYGEARSMARRMIEEALNEMLDAPFSPLLEPEDRITTPSGERLITKCSWSFSSGTVDEQLVCRFYGFV